MSPPTTPAPLAGLRVVVTRAVHQAASTVRAFEEAGAHVLLLPLLEVVPPEDAGPLERALASLGEYGWLVLTSTNAVERVLGRAEAPRALPPSLRVASVGGATSDALRELGVEPDLEPADSRAEGLAAELAARLGPGARVLLPQAADARPVLADELEAAGATVDRVNAYAKRTPPDARERAVEIFGDPSGDPSESGRLGWVTFTSPSIARAFAGLWGEDWPVRRRGLLAASIGPVTSDALRELGVEPAAEAGTPGDEGLVRAVIEAVRDRRPT